MATQGDFSRRRPDDARLPVRLPATIDVARMTGPQPGQLVDLSRGGLAVRFYGALDPGLPVRVTLHPRGRSPVTWVGRIAWTDRSFLAGEALAGVAFKDELSREFVVDLASEALP